MPECLPPGWAARPLDAGSYGMLCPGFKEIRITPRPGLFDDHPESMAWFAPGAPIVMRLIDELGGETLRDGELEMNSADGDSLDLIDDGMDRVLKIIRAGKNGL
jgi:hypothetical protein